MSFNNLSHYLAFLFRLRTVSRDMPGGNNGDGLETIHREETLDSGNVIVAHPASAEPTVGRCQAEMLHGDAEVDVAGRTQLPSVLFMHTKYNGAVANQGRS